MSKKIETLISVSFFCAMVLAFVIGVNAQTENSEQTSTGVAKMPAMSDHSAGHKHTETKEVSAAEKYFTDVELLDQDGNSVRFYNDVLKGKIVVINAMFTSCTNVCPLLSRNFEKIQAALGDRIGKDVFLVSVSVDPTVDTPERLKEYSKRFHAKSGWTFLTGKKENVDWALYKLGQYAETPGDHKTLVLIGNEATGLWKKALGLAPSDELIKLVNEVIEAK